MTHAGVLAGTFGGHALPGGMLILWALYWAVQEKVGPTNGATRRSLESNPYVPAGKVVLAVLGALIEIPGEGWYPQDVMMNWEHVTMYAAFGLTGVVDLLAHRRLVSPESTFVAYSAAMANAGFLFWAHSSHGGVEGLTHGLLALVFFAAALVAMVEVLRPSAGLRWGRIGTQLALGGWFIVGAWLLYRSGWDLADPVREGWTYMVFSWTAMGAATLGLGARLVAGTRSGS